MKCTRCDANEIYRRDQDGSKLYECLNCGKRWSPSELAREIKEKHNEMS